MIKISNSSKNSPTISVITASFNLGRFLEDTIHSIQNQSYKDWEHIVVDGGSTDNTVDILKKYPHIRWISEKDSGYHEAILKGLKMARGKYIFICVVSDGYVNRNWFKKCVEILESDPEVSLVWGFPQWMSEQGKLTQISYPHFRHFFKVPQKRDWFNYWLATGDTLPNGNFCVRKTVFEKCYPSFKKTQKGRDFFDFNYNFNMGGYLPFNIPTVADFGREHEGQLSKKLSRSGMYVEMLKNYNGKINDYKSELLSGRIKHVYRNGEGKVIKGSFSPKKFNTIYAYLLKLNIISCTVIQRGPHKIKQFINSFIGFH